MASSSLEEIFRDLLLSTGYNKKLSRSTLHQVFRLDQQKGNILTWFCENVTKENFLDPQMIQDYEDIQMRDISELEDKKHVLSFI